MKNYVGIRARLLVGILGLTLLSLGGTFWWFYTFTERSIRNHFTETANDILSSVDKNINADDLKALIAVDPASFIPGSGDVLDLQYQKIVKWLQLVERVDPRTHTYIYYHDGGAVRFVADSATAGSETTSVQFKEVYPVEDALKADFIAGLSAIHHVNNFQPHPSYFGDSLTAVGPIKNAAVEVVAALGVDIDTTYLYTPLRSSLINLAIVVSLALVILTVAVWLVSGRITRSISVLTAAASQIRSGQYDVDLSMFKKAGYDDEISTTAGVFQTMVEKVYKREQALKQEVMDLQIIIDETQRASQVEDIVDSDFFRGLQAKSRQFRRRKGRTEGESEETPSAPAAVT